MTWSASNQFGASANKSVSFGGLANQSSGNKSAFGGASSDAAALGSSSGFGSNNAFSGNASFGSAKGMGSFGSKLNANAPVWTGGSKSSDSKTSLFVRLPHNASVDEGALRTHFARFGKVKNATYIPKKGIAYVEMTEAGAAQAAVNLQSHKCGGSQLKVAWDFKGGAGRYQAQDASSANMVDSAKAAARQEQASRTANKVWELSASSDSPKTRLSKHSTSDMADLKKMAIMKAKEAQRKRTEKRVKTLSSKGGPLPSNLRAVVKLVQGTPARTPRQKPDLSKR